MQNEESETSDEIISSGFSFEPLIIGRDMFVPSNLEDKSDIGV